MAKAKYKPGDILTCWQFDKCVMTTVIVKPSVEEFYCDYDCYDYAVKEQYIKYDIFSVSKATEGFRMELGIPERTYDCYRLTGHIDISDMPIEEIKKNLDCAIRFEYCDNRIAHAIEEHWVFYKVDNYCFFSVQDKLAEECKQKQKHLDRASNKIFELKKEVDSLRQSLRDDSIRIYKNLSKMGFTEDAICSIMYSELNDI